MNNNTATTGYLNFQNGDRVKVVQFPTAPKEIRSIVGCEGRFVEYTRPHGYAVVQMGGCEELVHPENLQRIAVCAVKLCGFYSNDGSDYCPSHG